GVDAEKFKAEFKNPEHDKKVKEDIAANRKIGATGTPAFRINGVTLAGAQPFPKFKAVIDEQVTKAEALVKKGTAKNQVSLQLTKENFKNAPDDDKKADKKAP